MSFWETNSTIQVSVLLYFLYEIEGRKWVFHPVHLEHKHEYQICMYIDQLKVYSIGFKIYFFRAISSYCQVLHRKQNNNHAFVSFSSEWVICNECHKWYWPTRIQMFLNLITIYISINSILPLYWKYYTQKITLRSCAHALMPHAFGKTFNMSRHPKLTNAIVKLRFHENACWPSCGENIAATVVSDLYMNITSSWV